MVWLVLPTTRLPQSLLGRNRSDLVSGPDLEADTFTASNSLSYLDSHVVSTDISPQCTENTWDLQLGRW